MPLGFIFVFVLFKMASNICDVVLLFFDLSLKIMDPLVFCIDDSFHVLSFFTRSINLELQVVSCGD